MANTRSGGSQKDGRESASTSTRKSSPAVKEKDPKTPTTSSTPVIARETRSSSAREGKDPPNLRRSSRETPIKKFKLFPPDTRKLSTPVSHKSTRSSRDATPSSSEKKLKGVVESTRNNATRKSKRFNNNVSPSSASKDSSRTSSSVDTTKKSRKKQMGVKNPKKNKHDATEDTSQPSKKPKRLDARSYRALFKPSEQKTEFPVVAAHLRMDEKFASKARVAQNGTELVHEVGNAPEQDNQILSGEAVNEVSETSTSGLHETSETILEKDVLKTRAEQSSPFEELHMPVDMRLLRSAVKSDHPVLEAREQTADLADQSCLPELPCRPCSTIHQDEPKNAIEDGNSIGTPKEGRILRQIEVTVSNEIDGNDNDKQCVACKTPGILKPCDGKGCKRRYHLSCLDLPLECVSLGIWLCTICTKKRLQYGVYSVSEGVESLWDVKDGMQNGKQYFVKYKSLAHVHNRWVPESDIISSTPGGTDLVLKFNKRNHKEKTIRWKQEWAEPHRLLKKRSLMPPKEADEFFNSLGDKFAYCNVEWLVKWKDLGYEHATWELETSSFLCTPEAEELKKNYDNRHEAARRATDPAKINLVKHSPCHKLQRLPDGCPPGLDNDHLSSINQLRDFWHKSHGAVFIDDQERVIKTILFTMSILPDVCRPCLIISTSSSLTLWEAKFNRLAPSINVVLYNGEKGVRRSIQDLEFYVDGSVMLQVLLSHPDAISEDIESMECIGWEAVIVDECQSSRVSKCLEQLKKLSTDFRMVLLSSPLKDSIPEYSNLLSFLNPGERDKSPIILNGDSVDTAGSLAMLKSKFIQYVAYERKADSSKFLEYWVPARLSPVQLEIYCSTLLSNSSALRSHSKTDSVGALRDILVSLRKCCDHPYLVDHLLQNSLTKDCPPTGILDIGVHASGKLLLLDKMLQEIRNKGLRVLILFQSGGGGGNPMGDILEDFVRQRFGSDSYERVARGLLMSKKQAAMYKFNDKTNGRFIFLIESRACMPSIKLSSVDDIIIYGSDWNPVNDLRVLQKISIESQSERVSIFRIYSSCTVEEKALLLAKKAKKDVILDSNIHNIMPSVSHSLLSWGALFLFGRLDELQQHNYSTKGSDGDKLFTEKVILEFLTKLSIKVEASTEMNNAAISKAQLSGTSYSRDIIVEGEREGISALDGDPPTFWLSLLDGRSPHWHYISEPSQRSRRKVQNIEESVKIPVEETDEARIKRRKIGEIMGSSSSQVLPDKRKEAMLPENGTPSSSSQVSPDDTWQELGAENLPSTQKGLHVQLKPELSKLYELLELPENVKCLAEEFLEYILKNHQVSREPKGILHAFNISLCWRAASLLKHRVDRRESLALAVKHLNYECDEELAVFVYDKLRILKKKFSRRSGETSNHIQSTPVKNNTSLYQQESSTNVRDDDSIANKVTFDDSNLRSSTLQERSCDFWTEEMVLGGQDMLSVPETHTEQHLSKDELLNRITEKRINLVDIVFSLREKNIHDKQAHEISMLVVHRQKEVSKLREVCTLVLEHVRRSHSDLEASNGKIKLIIEWFTMLLCAFLEHMKRQQNKLEALQSMTWSKEQQLKAKFLQEAKSGQLDQSFDHHIPLPDSDFTMEEFNFFREKEGGCHIDATTLANCQQSLDYASAMEITLVRDIIPSEAINAEEVRNELAEVPVHSEGGPASEAADLSENRIHSSSDLSEAADLEIAVSSVVHHSSSSSPANENSINQELSSGDHRSTEHTEGDNIAGSSPYEGGAGQHLGDVTMEVNANNSDTVAAYPLQLESPIMTASSCQATLPMSREVEAQTNLAVAIQSAQQSAAPTWHPPAEAGQADLFGVAPARGLQTEMQTSTSVSNVPVERTHFDQSQIGHRPGTAPNPVQSTQLFPVSSVMFNHPPVDDEPLKNELHRLRLFIDSLRKIHEQKKTLLRTECSQEIEKIKRKYDLLLQEHDSTYLQQKKTLDSIYDQVLVNQSLAEDFRAKFIATSAAHARAHSPPMRQTPQASQQMTMRPFAMGSTASPVASSSAVRPPMVRHEPVASSSAGCPATPRHEPIPSSSANRPPMPRHELVASSSSGRPSMLRQEPVVSSSTSRPPMPRHEQVALSSSGRPSMARHEPVVSSSASRPQMPRPHIQTAQVTRSSSPSPQVLRPPSILPSNLVRATSSFSHIPPSRGNYVVRSEQARAPAPHLQRRLPLAHSMAPTNQQQQLPARLGVTPRTQFAPAIPGNLASSCSNVVPPVTSVPSSLHPVVPASSSPFGSLPAIPTSSLSSILNPVPTGTLPPSLSSVSCGTTVPLDAPLAGRHVEPSITGGQQADSESASLDAWLKTSLGLNSDPACVGDQMDGDIDLVCISDDESW